MHREACLYEIFAPVNQAELGLADLHSVFVGIARPVSDRLSAESSSLSCRAISTAALPPADNRLMAWGTHRILPGQLAVDGK